jgi:hypothetical protein
MSIAEIFDRASPSGRTQMKSQQVLAVLFAVVLVGAMSASVPVRADGFSPLSGDKGKGPNGDDFHSLAEFGLKIAPVPLNMANKDRDLVGYGSYLVNAVSGCNGCHSAGPQTEYSAGHNPYFLSQSPSEVNPATYLGGGRDFGVIGPPPSPHIVSRNLTPDKTGRAEGGASFNEFVEIIRTGTDFDHLHPNCSTTITTNCFNPPTDGSRLQIMPWPNYRNMSNQDLLAIYTYLSAIPCLSTGSPGDELYHDCGP